MNFFSFYAQSAPGASFKRVATETAMPDKNVVSKIRITQGQILPKEILDVAKQDIRAIKLIAQLTLEAILPGYGRLSTVSGQAVHFPEWRNGNASGLFQSEAQVCIKKLFAFHAKNGCGVYVKYRVFFISGKRGSSGFQTLANRIIWRLQKKRVWNWTQSV